ncbi:IPT/TIG domain-containing protein [Chitinophaga sp. GCM10012297]|uniref:IPT/TIG domain-containing protein n=1 Tax=Chitinophaga chungangae TaxID=2821488 RepID=A0ABS3YIR2_9BACT|nr:IPT/TIG domain-containing protein [Chitinophaga chungangae]MBO9154578.1 IPT/TIG domain-containing protein [Chitinophaga chungangae]
MKHIITGCLLLALFFSTGCNKDEDKQQPAGPVVTAIWPSSGTAGIIVTLKGKNFSYVRAENKVQFNGADAVVIEAASNQLQVVSPASGATGPVTVEVGNNKTQGPVYAYVPAMEEYIVETFSGSTAGSVDGPVATALFRNPEGVAIDANGRLIVTDRGNNRIRMIAGGNTSAIAGNTAAGYTDATGAAAQFKLPWKAAADAAGNIYVADRDNHAIRKITPAGEVSTLAGGNGAGYADGAGAAAKFNQPLDVAVDAAGNVYVADNLNHRIRKVTPDGTVTTLAGSSAGFANGTGAAAQFKNPSGLDIDKDGNILVADRLNHRIRKVTPAGEVTVIAGDGNTGYRDGDAAGARFADPYGISGDKNGNIFIADLNNNKIRKVDAEGIVSTIAGTAKGYADGAGAAAQFNGPTDVCVDADGVIYVADLTNHCIRKISLMK